MNEIEQKALKLLNEVLKDCGSEDHYSHIDREITTHEALCRAIEQHEAFKQEVSDAVEAFVYANSDDVPTWEKLNSLIIPTPKPDPLVVLCDHIGLGHTETEDIVNELRAALEACGLEIREKNDD